MVITVFSMLQIQRYVFFKKSVTDGDDFIQITIPPGACESESLKNEIRRNIFDEEILTESDYSFQIKPNFSTLGRILTIVLQGLIISFAFDDELEICYDFLRLYYTKNIIYHLSLLIFYQLIILFSNVILLKKRFTNKNAANYFTIGQ